MARFPIAQNDIAELAESIVAGLTENDDVYPDPPVTPGDLRTAIFEVIMKHDAVVAARAAAEEATSEKDAALGHLVDLMKDDIRYCENTVDFDDDKLKLIGWGGRKPRTPLQAPGQTRALEAPVQGPGRVRLDWKAPSDGGKPAAYRVQRRAAGADDWTDAGMAVDTEILLQDQPRGQSLEYQVIAVNKAGEGMPSNMVTVVL